MRRFTRPRITPRPPPGPRPLIGHAIQGEQVGHVPLLKPHPAVFHPADLGPGRPDFIPRLVVRDARYLAKAVQLVSEHHAQHRRAQGLGRRLAARLNRVHRGSRTRWISAQRPHPAEQSPRHHPTPNPPPPPPHTPLSPPPYPPL